MSFEVSPQPMYINDPGKYGPLAFDGVIKVQHALALKIEDDAANIKDEDKQAYVNNAKNEPNEVTMDVMMSDAYTTGNALAGTTGNRAKNAYEILKELKTSRRKVQVITTILTYNDMLIKSIQVLQDESTPYGWSASITLREAPDNGGAAANATQAASCVDDGTLNGRTPSILVPWFGANALTRQAR